MKFVVLGATGATGLEIVKQGIQRGHTVTAFVRSPERLSQFRDQIAIKQGNLLDSGELERAVHGNDAVISAFGPRVPISKADAHLLEQFASALVSGMQRAKVSRVVIESVAFLFRNAIMPPAYLLGRLFFPGVIADASAMERIVGKSKLDWTLVRPPQLTDKPYTGRYRIRESRLPVFGFKISRSDVADYMLKAVENHAASRKVVGICN